MTSPAEGSAIRNGEVGADREGRVDRRLGDLAEFVREAAYLTSKGREAYLADSMEGAVSDSFDVVGEFVLRLGGSGGHACTCSSSACRGPTTARHGPMRRS